MVGELIAETKHAPIELRRFVGEELSSLLRLTAFQDVIQSTAQDPDRETLIYERLDRLIEFGVRI